MPSPIRLTSAPVEVSGPAKQDLRLAVNVEPFEPTKLEGCILWLRSDRGVSVSSGNVATWSDASGSGNDATQGTSADRPGYLASGWSTGLPTVDFDASSSEWMEISTLSDSSDDYSLFCVLDQRNQATSPQNILTSRISYSRQFSPVTNSSAGVGIFDGSAWRSTGAEQNGEQCLTWVIDSSAGTVECFRNGSYLLRRYGL